MNNVRYTFQLDNQLKNAFLASAKQANQNGAEILRDLMREFVQKQAMAQTQKISLADKLAGVHAAADVDFECKREVEKFRVAEFD